eukprot:1290288-Lingulodinium_polyedra.AAC.1
MPRSGCLSTRSGGAERRMASSVSRDSHMGGGDLDLAVDHDGVGLIPRVVSHRRGLGLRVEPGLRLGGIRLALGVRRAPEERG